MIWRVTHKASGERIDGGWKLKCDDCTLDLKLMDNGELDSVDSGDVLASHNWASISGIQIGGSLEIEIENE